MPNKPLSNAEFQTFGIDEMAYVKPILINNVPFLAVHAANGDALCTLSQRREVAFATVTQYGLAPVSVH